MRRFVLQVPALRRTKKYRAIAVLTGGGDAP